MQLVYKANNLFDAHLAKHALEDAGIPAFVLGETLLGGMGELPLFGLLRVCVADASLPEASRIIAQLDLGAASAVAIDEADDEGAGILPA